MSMAVFGSINVDTVVRVPRMPKPGETIAAMNVETFFGGKGANQAVAAARAGADVTMIGAVGADAHADTVLANFAQQGVTQLITRTESLTGSAFIWVDDAGENSITIHAGANAHLTGHELGTDELSAFDALVCQAEVRLESVATIARTFRRARPDGRLILNLAPVPPSADAGHLAELVGLCDILVVNEQELMQTAACTLASATSARGANENLAALAGTFATTVVVTLGARGALATRPDGETVKVATLKVDAVDTTGAGDTFAGVLAASLDVGFDLEAALRRACIGGALACQGLGAQTAMPDARAIDAFALEQGGSPV